MVCFIRLERADVGGVLIKTEGACITSSPTMSASLTSFWNLGPQAVKCVHAPKRYLMFHRAGLATPTISDPQLLK